MQNTDLGIDSAVTDILCISLNILMIAWSKTIMNKTFILVELRK